MLDNEVAGTGTNGTIDRHSPVPLYYQLKQILLRRILDEKAVPGESIPSEKELQDRYQVSRITVRRAVNDLASEGYVTREPGRGTFVRPAKLQDLSQTLGGFVDDLRSQGFNVGSEILKSGWQLPPPYVVEKLGCGSDEVYFLKRLLIADGEPIALARGYLRVGRQVVLTPEEMNSTSSVYILLERKYGIQLRRATKTIEATVVCPTDAAVLNAKPNVPMLRSELVVFDDRDQPAAFISCLYRGDRYKYNLTVTR